MTTQASAKRVVANAQKRYIEKLLKNLSKKLRAKIGQMYVSYTDDDYDKLPFVITVDFEMVKDGKVASIEYEHIEDEDEYYALAIDDVMLGHMGRNFHGLAFEDLFYEVPLKLFPQSGF